MFFLLLGIFARLYDARDSEVKSIDGSQAEIPRVI